VIQASRAFVPVFIDTLKDADTTRRFGEHYGSYPVLRVHDLSGKDIGGRLDGNACAGNLPLNQLLEQLQTRL
jgi:hypothetical protein